MAQTAKAPVLIIELTDRVKSGFVLEGSREEGHAVHLDGPDWRRIPSESVVVLEDGTYRRIRHIQNAPSIFLDEQEKMGYTYNATRDNIILKTVTTVVRTGRDVNKYDYLRACEYNFHAENSPSPENVLFREIRAEEVASSGVPLLKLKKRVADIIDQLYTEVEDKTQYDVPRMNTVARALGINEAQDAAIVLMSIAAFGERDPKRFLSSIADRTVEYRQDIKEAIHLGVLSIDDSGASLPVNKMIFYKFKKKNPSDRIEELVMYYLSSDGAMDYKNLRAELDVARAAVSAAVK